MKIQKFKILLQIFHIKSKIFLESGEDFAFFILKQMKKMGDYRQ